MFLLLSQSHRDQGIHGLPSFLTHLNAVTLCSVFKGPRHASRLVITDKPLQEISDVCKKKPSEFMDHRGGPAKTHTSPQCNALGFPGAFLAKSCRDRQTIGSLERFPSSQHRH